jgi:histone deacetylase 6
VYEGSDFAESLECSFFANSVSITGNTEDKSGLVTLYVSKVANPPDEITTDNLLVKTYDGFKKEIIAKSFANLDPFQFTFHFPGPLIKINGDQPIIVERGT